MSATAPLVSIGLPVYNGERYLDSTIEAILGQTHADIELVISDNGSTDDTETICRTWADKDARVRYHRSDTNRGAAWNYNRTFELSSGEYFKWAAHDDLLAPRYVEACLEGFRNGPSDLVLVYPSTTFIGGDGEVLSGLRDEDLDLTGESPSARLRLLLHRVAFCNAVFGLIRRDVLATTKLIVAYDSSDILLLAELITRGKFHRLPEVLFQRRWHQAMSVAANATRAELEAWFDPSSKLAKKPRRRLSDMVHTKELRLAPRHVRSILGAPLPRSTRWKCAATVVTATPRAWARQAVRAERRRRRGQRQGLAQ